MAVPPVRATSVDALADSDSDPRCVLIVAAFFPPWGGVGGMRITKLVKYLPGHGWTSTVICSDEQNPEVRDDTLLDDVPATVAVHRIRGPLGGVGGISGQAAGAWRAGRGRTILGLAKAVARAFIIPDRWVGWSSRVAGLPATATGRPDVVVSSGPPHSAHFAAARISRRLKVPFVMDMRDDWYGNPMHASAAPWHDPLERAMERWCMSRADRIVVVSDAAVEILLQRRPELAGRVVAIPNGFDPEDLDQASSQGSGLGAEPVDFLFAGTLRRGQSVGRFFEAFGTLARQSATPVRLRFLGVVDAEHLTRAAEVIPSRSLQVSPPIDHRSALVQMRRAGVLVVFTGQGGAGAATMTGKLYEYLGVRRPILVVGPDGPAVDLVRSAGAGVTAPPDDGPALRAALDEVMRLARDADYAGASAEVLDRFDRRTLAAEWNTVLRNVLAGSG